MDRYYVKQIEEGMYGVFDSRPYNTKIHCPDDDPNLIVYTYEKIYAEKIAEMLNVDEFIHERYLEEN